MAPCCSDTAPLRGNVIANGLNFRAVHAIVVWDQTIHQQRGLEVRLCPHICNIRECIIEAVEADASTCDPIRSDIDGAFGRMRQDKITAAWS